MSQRDGFTQVPPPNAGRVQRLLQPRRRLHFAPEIPGDVRVNRQREMHSSCEGRERRKAGMRSNAEPLPSLNRVKIRRQARTRGKFPPTSTSTGRLPQSPSSSIHRPPRASHNFVHFAPEISGDVRASRQREMHSSCEGRRGGKSGGRRLAEHSAGSVQPFSRSDILDPHGPHLNEQYGFKQNEFATKGRARPVHFN